ncbi:helix-turn-helix domain-containing protein [Streptomyces sp. NPDC057686]|uniref:helix-turn-helix domain-containing protein n=1 Tax=Streptomyces sp. NPDC057686 TaxID=3346212 RepID=UPI0036946362
MLRWKRLPEELDPQVREFTGHLRRLVDHSGLSTAAVADRTGYSETSWERYLNGRLLAPKRAVLAFAEATGADPDHLVTMWELAERAWSRSEMRHDATMEMARITEARAALESLQSPPDGARARRSGRAGTVDSKEKGDRSSRGPTRVRLAAQPSADPRPARSHERSRRRALTAASLGLLLIGTAGLLLPHFTRDQNQPDGAGKNQASRQPVPQPVSADTPSPTQTEVGCARAECAGLDPETTGCSGTNAKITSTVRAGTALVEARYSAVCGAAWARIRNAAPGDRVRILVRSASQSSQVRVGSGTYTRMLAVDDESGARACATLVSGARTCTPVG